MTVPQPPLERGLTSSGIEYTLHSAPQRLRSELEATFPGMKAKDMTIVCTCQRASMDLSGRGDAVEEEKDCLLEQFSGFAANVCTRLLDAGFWADYVDPCSGLPALDRRPALPFDEVAAVSLLRGYRIQSANCCKILLHPQWGSAVYPASLTTTAPVALIKEAIRAADEQLRRCEGGVRKDGRGRGGRDGVRR